MTETYGIFDAADPENPDRVYSAAILMGVMSRFLRDGIVHGDGSGLAVSPTVPAAMTVSVGTGSAIVQGRYYINDDDLVLPIGAANPTYPRIDRVVLRLNITPDRTIHAAVVPGVPAETPEPPALVRTSEIWELSLAQVAVGAGATSIVAGDITDERANPSLCGVAAPVYVPSSQLEVVGAVDMQGHALTGLPVPSAATDAARKVDIGAGVPPGAIIIWSGSVSNIPSGWVLCNGSNGTPNLQNRFVIGAGSSYGVGATGGSTTHTLTTSQLPVVAAHSHVLRGGISDAGVTGTFIGNSSIVSGNYKGSGKSLTTQSAGGFGGGAAHNNMPPYYALCYIMKT